MQSAPLLRIGTRGSLLAMAQATLVQRLLAEAHGVDLSAIEIRVFTTSGDRITDRPLSEAGGKGLFSKEIEAALEADEIDLGVHSSKDLASVLPDGLTLAAFLEREDVRDAFVSLRMARSPSCRRAQSSARPRSAAPRRCGEPARTSRSCRSAAMSTPASASSKRALPMRRCSPSLGSTGSARPTRSPSISIRARFPPAPAQGAIGIEIHDADARTRGARRGAEPRPTATTIAAERALLTTLDRIVSNAHRRVYRGEWGFVQVDRRNPQPRRARIYRDTVEGKAADAASLGTQLGHRLLDAAGPDFQRQFKG